MSDTPRTPIQDRIASMMHAFDDEGRRYAVRLLAQDVGELERELTAAQAEIARLKAGGCARDQRTTQFCGEAVKLQEENARLQERIARLEAHGSWIPASTKPEGWERKVLCWVVWPACGWPAPPEAIIGWWKHGPGCFAVANIECADHLVTHWMEIADPSEAKGTQ